MSSKLSVSAILLATLLLNGCSYLKFPGVHKIDVQQGNIITQEMVDQLKPGMSKSQVRFVMGTPLIADSFNQNRWDYYYSLKKGSEQESRERISIFFNDDGTLSRLSGDFAPTAAVKNSPEQVE